MRPTNKKIGAFMLVAFMAILGLATMSFADAGRLTTQILITPNSAGTAFTATVYAFNSTTTQSGTTTLDTAQASYQSCLAAHPGGTPADQEAVIACYTQAGYSSAQNTHDYQYNLYSVQNAHLQFCYFNPVSQSCTPLPGCQDLYATTAATSPPSTGTTSTPTTYYTVTCTPDPSFMTGRAITSVQVNFIPEATETVALSGSQTINGLGLLSSTDSFDINNAQVTSSTDFTSTLTDAFNTLSQGRSSVTGGNVALPSTGSSLCFAGFILLGLLLASMYFSGRSPLSLLDITTPKLPTSKPLTAGGQIVTPFGYSELTKGINKKLGANAAAVATMSSRVASELNPTQIRTLNSITQASSQVTPPVTGTTGSVSLADQTAFSKALVTAGVRVGSQYVKADQLVRLAKKPPANYTPEDHAVVAQIFHGLENLGESRYSVYASLLRQQFQGYAAINTLAVLSGHPSYLERQGWQTKFVNTVNKFTGHLSGVGSVTGSVPGSVIRTGRVMKDMTVTMGTQLPSFARNLSRSTMELVAGNDVMDRLQAASGRSALAAWTYTQLTKHPPSIEVGSMSPVHEKMGYLYRQLRNEAMRDQMRYLIRKMYTKTGVSFDISEAELVKMGHKDSDILVRTGYKRTPEIDAMEREINQILGNKTLSGYEKVQALERLATEVHHVGDLGTNYKSFKEGIIAIEGQYLDHESTEFRKLARDPTTRDYEGALGRFDHLRLLSMTSFLEAEGKAAERENRFGSDDYACHVGYKALKGPAAFEQYVIRARIYDAEEGHIAKDSNVGLGDTLKRTWLDNMNRMVSLMPTRVDISRSKGAQEANTVVGMESLPENMRDADELKRMEARAATYMKEMFTADGWSKFTKLNPSLRTDVTVTPSSNTTDDPNHHLMAGMLGYLTGGATPKFDPHSSKGRAIWWGEEKELPVPEGSTKVDMKRHWLDGLNSREGFAIAQGVFYRADKSYEKPYDADIERELNKTPGHESWSDQERERRTQDLMVRNTRTHDLNNMFNSLYAGDAYNGRTREIGSHYLGNTIGCIEKLVEEGSIKLNDVRTRSGAVIPEEEVKAVLRNADIANPKHLEVIASLMSQVSGKISPALQKINPADTADLRLFKDMVLKGEILIPQADNGTYDINLMKSGKSTTKAFLETADLTNPEHVDRMRTLVQMAKSMTGFEEILQRKVTYEDLATSKRPYIRTAEGGFVFYHKGMMMSDGDLPMGSQVVMKDHHGQLRPFVPDDINIRFKGNSELTEEFERVRSERDPLAWESFLNKSQKWAGLDPATGGSSRPPMSEEMFERRQVHAAALWLQSQTTFNYQNFWNDSGVELVSRRSVAPLAPSFLRMFGVDGSSISRFTKGAAGIRDAIGDYAAAIALQGGSNNITGTGLVAASYMISPQTEVLRQNSWRMSSGIMSGEWLKGMSDQEKAKLMDVAKAHFGFHQSWDYAIDRSMRISSSHGTAATGHTGFVYGPMKIYALEQNIGANTTPGQLAMHQYGPTLAFHSISHAVIKPFVDIFAGVQRSMQGQGNKWTQRNNPLGVHELTSPRIFEAMESLSSNSASLRHHQLAGPEFRQGLAQAPQDRFALNAGTYANVRTGEANPGASYYDYRYTLQLDPIMAEFVRRERVGSFLYDQSVQEAAWKNTTRRTVAVEALAMKRSQEVNTFGAAQNPLFGWSSPLAFFYHMPPPFWPASLTPRDMVAGMVSRYRQGKSISFDHTIANMTSSVTGGVTRLVSPTARTRTVYCKCGGSGFRYGRCHVCNKPL